MPKRNSLLFLLIALAGCVAQPTATPEPLSVPRISTTPELEELVISWVLQYRTEIDDAIIHVQTLSPQVVLSSIEAGVMDLAIIGIDPPESFFATPLSRQPVVVVVNPENDVDSLNLDQLRALFSGRAYSWEGITGETISAQPVVPLQGDSTRIVFEKVVIRDASLTPNALLAPTPNLMRAMIVEHSGSIGFVLQSYIDNELKQIGIEGVMPGNAADQAGDYPLWIDVLAVSIEEPQGILRDFLVWLQGTEIR